MNLNDEKDVCAIWTYEQVIERCSDLFERFPSLVLPKVNDDLYYYDNLSATNVVDFFQREMHHVEGPLAGELFRLEAWEEFIIRMIFGWKRKAFNEDGKWINTSEQLQQDVRKFRDVFVFVPRKNGKSYIGAGFALQGLFADNEIGARVVSAAADREQAALIYDVAKQIVEENPRLHKKAITYRRTMVVEQTASNYKVLSADVKTKHGKNLTRVVVDEVHAQPNRDLIDVLFTSVGARIQPLKIMLTTAGFDKMSICYELYDYAKKVIEGIVTDEEFLPIIFEPSEKDDWRDEKTWIKVNPNLGISVQWDYFRSEFKKACERPSYENTFKRLHLNFWTEQETRWVPIEIWDECNGEINLQELEGAVCFAGVDLASKVDITALALVFPVGNQIKVLWDFWMPKNNIPLRHKRDRVDYDVWVRQGYIHATEGNVMDYDCVRKRIHELRTKYHIKEIGFDPWNAQDLIAKVGQDGLECVQVNQTFSHLTNPTKELEALVLSHRIAHGGNPVARWMFRNISVFEDGNGNIKLNKKASKEKIDGIVALVNALSRYQAYVDKETAYNKRGLRTIG
jgi:phage terminase large subunit-like protein